MIGEYLSMSIKVKNSSKLNFSTVPVIYDAPGLLFQTLCSLPPSFSAWDIVAAQQKIDLVKLFYKFPLSPTPAHDTLIGMLRFKWSYISASRNQADKRGLCPQLHTQDRYSRSNIQSYSINAAT